MSEVAPAARSLEELEAIIERGLKTFVEVGTALLEIREQRLYRQQGFTTFEDYCRERWQWGRNYANKQIAAAEVVRNLGTNVPTPRTEAQARELTGLRPDEQRAVASQIDFRTATAAEIRTQVATTISPPITDNVRVEQRTPPVESDVTVTEKPVPPPPAPSHVTVVRPVPDIMALLDIGDGPNFSVDGAVRKCEAVLDMLLVRCPDEKRDDLIRGLLGILSEMVNPLEKSVIINRGDKRQAIINLTVKGTVQVIRRGLTAKQRAELRSKEW